MVSDEENNPPPGRLHDGRHAAGPDGLQRRFLELEVNRLGTGLYFVHLLTDRGPVTARVAVVR